MEKHQSKHILIIDDSPDQQFLLKMLLEAKGFTAECTPNGKEALSLLRSKTELPQTILLDLNMEIMSGYEFRKIQCEDPLLRDIPVIVVSGEENAADVRKQMRSDVIQKPITITSLLEAIKRNSKLH